MKNCQILPVCEFPETPANRSKLPSGQLWSHRTQIINDLIGITGALRYLEIGCGDGRHFAAVRCAEKVSVDPADGRYANAQPTHRMTSDQFFSGTTGKFDLIFIDGLHHADQVGRDLRNSLSALKPGGIVLCHDLNPETEIMQAVPRQCREWTGDGWKAWVALRDERPDLTMLVVEADYGVGVILTGNRGGAGIPVRRPELSGDGNALKWPDLVQHRQKWLNLMHPQAARDTVISQLGRKPPLTVATLWRAGWNDAQQRVLDWLCRESFPDGTLFLWAVQAGSGTTAHLERAWMDRPKPFPSRSVETMEIPCASPKTEVERHSLIASLYTAVLTKVASDTVLVVEDDVVPAVGSAQALIEDLGRRGPETAAVMGAYRSRKRPECVCAHDMDERYFSWAVADGNQKPAALPAAWIGGGLTLYRTAWLKPCLPFQIGGHSGRVEGWDRKLCSRLRKQGGKLWVLPQIQADHLCPEVLRHLAGLPSGH